MDTTSGNRAINEFMGVKYRPEEVNPNPSSSRLVYDTLFSSYEECLNHCENLELLWDNISVHRILPRTEVEMNYESNWNQLMPVVEHIESLGFEVLIRKPFPDQSLCEILHKDMSFWCSKSHKDKKMCIWLAVVAFIEWYNENK